MKHAVASVADLGTIVRATRKYAGVRMDDLAATTNMSKQFVNDVELGKPGVQLGKVFEVLQELGIHVYVDVPGGVANKVASSRSQIEKTNLRRKARAKETPTKAIL